MKILEGSARGPQINQHSLSAAALVVSGDANPVPTHPAAILGLLVADEQVSPSRKTSW